MDRSGDCGEVKAQMPGISAAGTLARYFSLRFLIAMLAMFAICCVLIFFVDFIEMRIEGAFVLRNALEACNLRLQPCQTGAKRLECVDHVVDVVHRSCLED